jgi:WD40 repeat protein
METSDLKWSVKNAMIAANANTVFNAIDYERTTKLVAYAASNSVMILDPTLVSDKYRLPKVLFVLNAHTTRVNAVQWLSPNSLVSIGGDEKLIVVWTCSQARVGETWKVHQLIGSEISGHSSTLTHLRAYRVSENEQYFTTMDVGGDLRVWAMCDDGKFVLKSSLLFGRNLQETTVMNCIGNDHLMLLTGGYDSKIHVYTTLRQSAASPLTFQFSMLGHLNSIKDLAFSPLMTLGVMYLASASQDQNIRIWKV